MKLVYSISLYGRYNSTYIQDKGTIRNVADPLTTDTKILLV